MSFINFVETELTAAEIICGTEKDILIKMAKIYDNQLHSGLSATLTLGLLVTAQKQDKYFLGPDTIDGYFAVDTYTKRIITAANELLMVVNTYRGNKENLVRNFITLASYKPLTPLTLDDDEFVEIRAGEYQNKRNPAVFKEGINGKPYYMQAFIKIADNTYARLGGSLVLSNGKQTDKCYIKDPANMPTIEIIVPIKRQNSDDDNDLEFLPLDPNDTQVKELEKYYEVTYVNANY